MADREIKCNDMDLVATQTKPLVSQGESNAYIRESQDDPLKYRGGNYNFYLSLHVIETIQNTWINM